MPKNNTKAKARKAYAKANGIDLKANKFHKPPKESNTKKTKAERRQTPRRYFEDENGKKRIPTKERMSYPSGSLKKYETNRNGEPVQPKLSNRQQKLKQKALKSPNSSFGQRYRQQQRTRQQQLGKRLNQQARASLGNGEGIRPEDYYKMFPLVPEFNTFSSSDNIETFASLLNQLNQDIQYLDFQGQIKVSLRNYNYLKSHYRSMHRDFDNVNTYYQRMDWFGRDNKYGRARKDMGYRLMKDFVWPNCNNIQNLARALKIISKQLDDWTGDWQVVYYSILG